MNTTGKTTEIKLNIEEEYHALQNKYALQAQQIEELTAKLNWYEEQFNLSKHKRFGSSSEQTDSNQLSVFNEAEKESRPEKEEPTIEEITYKREKKKGLNKKSFDDLPVEVIEYRLEESDQICPACNNQLQTMRER